MPTFAIVSRLGFKVSTDTKISTTDDTDCILPVSRACCLYQLYVYVSNYSCSLSLGTRRLGLILHVLPTGRSLTHLIVSHILMYTWSTCQGGVGECLFSRETTTASSAASCCQSNQSTQVNGYSRSNVILVDEKLSPFHQYLGYSHKCGTITFSIPSAII